MKKEKVLTSADVANEELVQGLVSTLNESAQVAWFLKSVNYLDNEVISVRGLKATIAKASDSTWLKESHVPYFKTAHALRAKSGGDKVALKKVITTVQDAKRAWKAEEFAVKFESAKTFKEFADSIPARDSKARGASKKTASEKDVKAVAVDADAVATLALGLFRELEGDKAIFRDLGNARALASVVKTMLDNSRAVSNHPAERSKVSA